MSNSAEKHFLDAAEAEVFIKASKLTLIESKREKCGDALTAAPSANKRSAVEALSGLNDKDIEDFVASFDESLN